MKGLAKRLAVPVFWLCLDGFSIPAKAHVVINHINANQEQKYLFFKSGESLERYTCSMSVVAPTPETCDLEPVQSISAAVLLRYKLFNSFIALTRDQRAQRDLVSEIDRLDAKILAILNYDPVISNQRMRMAKLDVTQAEHGVSLTEQRVKELEVMMKALLDRLLQDPSDLQLINEQNRLYVATIEAAGQRDKCVADLFQRRSKLADLVEAQKSDALLLALREQRNEQADRLKRVNHDMTITSDEILAANKFYESVVFNLDVTPLISDSNEFSEVRQLIDDYSQVNGCISVTRTALSSYPSRGLWRDVTLKEGQPSSCSASPQNCTKELIPYRIDFGPVLAQHVTWYEGLNVCNLSVHNGFDDWRLPTKDELALAIQSGISGVTEAFWISDLNVCRDVEWTSTQSDVGTAFATSLIAVGVSIDGNKSHWATTLCVRSAN
ncbi:MAG: hypothetical protein NTV34_07840 [Proteobacteria bacterium]|nr:hypothetical protein [Pseudomonadota bacterium]